ncbi:MAG: ATP-dependent helicase, partial [Candidatus Rokubacteria bacterium]|nr:ATP-dependent helicase [Candidatus Rokubacteria bacterium]
GGGFLSYVYGWARAQRVGVGRAWLNGYGQGFPGGPTASSNRARDLVEGVLAWLGANPTPDEEPQDGWGRWILKRAGSDVAPTATENLRDLLGSLEEGLAEPDQSLGRYLGQLGSIAKDQAQARSAGVRIMTMQSAKGLTVRATIVAAVEEGIIPRPDAALAEERRLLYVAMTRTREFLFCTWARRRLGPTARAGRPRVGTARPFSSFLRGGPVGSVDGGPYIRERWR